MAEEKKAEKKGEDKTPRHKKMYKDSPHLEKGEDGKTKIKKGPSKSEKKASETNAGTAGSPEHDMKALDMTHKHAKERLDLHHKHEKEQMALASEQMQAQQAAAPQEEGAEPAPQPAPAAQE